MMPLMTDILRPDLTHPQELVQVGLYVLELTKTWIMLLIAMGLVFAALNWSFQRRDRPDWLTQLMTQYGQWFGGLQHVLLVLVITVSGFLLCSTLANRYHHWEQDKLTLVANSVAGERIEQSAPYLRYTVDEPYTAFTYVDGNPTEVERIRQVERFLTPSASQVNVDINQVTDPATERYIYQSNVSATYQVTNTVDVTQFFQFQVSPPKGYTLLQNYRVERDRQRLISPTQDYQFPVTLAPQQSTTFQVTYQAQGAPRWVFNADGRLLSKFDLKMVTHFPNANFASGVVPTATRTEGDKTEFVWRFEDNVSVQNPFGVFTSTQRFRNTGILPRLLILAPGIFLWWLLMLYCSMPVRLMDIVISAVVFFACLLGLTYASRLMDARWAWGVLLWVLLVWGGQLGRSRVSGILITLCSVVLPVAALLIPYTGMTLAIAALLSVLWLIKGHYRRNQISDNGNLSENPL
jgi:hypothetical protein